MRNRWYRGSKRAGPLYPPFNLPKLSVPMYINKRAWQSGAAEVPLPLAPLLTSSSPPTASPRWVWAARNPSNRACGIGADRLAITIRRYNLIAIIPSTRMSHLRQRSWAGAEWLGVVTPLETSRMVSPKWDTSNCIFLGALRRNTYLLWHTHNYLRRCTCTLQSTNSQHTKRHLMEAVGCPQRAPWALPP
jgi:hypothetical protein